MMYIFVHLNNYLLALIDTSQYVDHAVYCVTFMCLFNKYLILFFKVRCCLFIVMFCGSYKGILVDVPVEHLE